MYDLASRRSIVLALGDVDSGPYRPCSGGQNNPWRFPIHERDRIWFSSLLHKESKGRFRKARAGTDAESHGRLDSVSMQLGKENRKFMFAQVAGGSRGKVVPDALEWILDAGSVYKVHPV